MKDHFLRRFQVEGLNLEKLLRLAAERKMDLLQVRHCGRRMTGLVAEKRLPELEELAAQGGWALRLGGYAGLSRWRERLKARWVVCALVLLALGGVLLSMQMIWAVELIDAGTYAGDVRAFLEEAGVRPFIWKSRVDTAALKEALEWRYPKVAWVEVGWRGTVLQVRLVEGTPMGETVDWHGSQDIVASRDGVVVSVVPLAGTAMCKPGDTVRQGQVLIAGEEREGTDGTRPVSARGIVMARVWEGARVQVSLRENQTEYTGATFQRQYVSTPWFNLWPREESGFAQQDIHAEIMPLGGLFLPLWVRRETCLEAQVTVTWRDLDQAKAEAGLAALRALGQKIGRNEVFVDKWVDYCMIEGEILEAVAMGERRIDIGRSEPRTDGGV